MNKEDFLQPPTEQVFIEIDFINKYKRLGDQFNVRDENFKMANTDVIKIAHELGYMLKYSKEKEFNDLKTKKRSVKYRFRKGILLM